MDNYLLVGTLEELSKKPSKVISYQPNNAETRQISVFNINNTFYAIDNLCAHKQACISQGDIEDISTNFLTKEEEGACKTCVKCPKHKKKFAGGGLYFNLASGRAIVKGQSPKFDPSWKLATYEVKQEDGKIYVGKTPLNGARANAPKAGKKKKAWGSVILTNIQRYNHDSFIYDFQLEVLTYDMVKKEKNKKLQKVLKEKAKGAYEINSRLSDAFECWHLDLRALDGSVTREYTPISTFEDFRTSQKLKLLVKLYEDGLMSNVLAKSKVGDTLWIGPLKKTIDSKFFELGSESTLACIAGGTGITPVFQMLVDVETRLKSGKNAPKISLLYSNKKVEDILLKDELEHLQKQYPNHFTVVHTLTREDPNHFDSTGFLFGRISTEMIKKYLSPSNHVHTFVSGPSGMWTTVFELLKNCGYNESACTELEA